MHLITTVHGWVKHTSRTPLYYGLDRFSLRSYEHVMAVSDDLMDRCKEIGVRRDRLTLILNGIDERTFSRHFPPSESPLRQEHRVPPGRLLLGRHRLGDEGRQVMRLVTHELEWFARGA